MTSTSLNPDEIRAAAETHSELGREYQSAVIESFIDKVGREIDARVDARLAQIQPQAPMQRSSSAGRGGPLALAIVSMSLGIPLTGILAGTHYSVMALAIVWIAIAVINVAFSLHSRPPSRGR